MKGDSPAPAWQGHTAAESGYQLCFFSHSLLKILFAGVLFVGLGGTEPLNLPPPPADLRINFPPENAAKEPRGCGTTHSSYGTTPVWCRGGNRYVETCWGFPYLNKEKFVGFTIHAFLIDMKFISKILKNILQGSSSCPLPIFTNFACSNVQIPKFSIFQFTKNQTYNFQFFKLSILKLSKIIYHFQKIECQTFKKLGTQTFHNVQNFRFTYMKIICSRMFPKCFLYFVQYLGDKYRVRGSTFGRLFGSCRN